MNTNITWITIRVRLHVPRRCKQPDRVRVLVKERGALFFPFQRELMSIPLYKVNWKKLQQEVYYNEQAKAVPVCLDKLLKRAEKQRLALQLYCLSGSMVQHKALGSFTRLMQQQCNGELLLTLHYFGCPRHLKKAFSAHGRDSNVLPAVDFNNCFAQAIPEVSEGQPDDGVQRSTAGQGPCVVIAAPQLPATASVQEEAQGCSEEVTPPSSETLTHSRPVRFRESGSVFVELLHGYELNVAQEEAAAKATEEKTAENGQTRSQSTRYSASWRRRVYAAGATGSLLYSSATGVQAVLPQQVQLGVVLAGVASMLFLAMGYCRRRLARRRGAATLQHMDIQY